MCLFALDKAAAIPVDTHVWQLACRHYTPHLRNKMLTKPVRLSQRLQLPASAFAGPFGLFLFAFYLTTSPDISAQTFPLPGACFSSLRRCRGINKCPSGSMPAGLFPTPLQPVDQTWCMRRAGHGGSGSRDRAALWPLCWLGAQHAVHCRAGVAAGAEIIQVVKKKFRILGVFRDTQHIPETLQCRAGIAAGAAPLLQLHHGCRWITRV